MINTKYKVKLKRPVQHTFITSVINQTCSVHLLELGDNGESQLFPTLREDVITRGSTGKWSVFT